jgi:SAM-dependent methyltransferase
MLRKGKDCYKGMTIGAAAGTHEAVAAIVKKYCQRDTRILELGAYTGAMIQRLRDLGYSAITAADLDNHLILDDVPHLTCDFNTQFAPIFRDERFDCIIATEVIEHLDDPRAFLRQCRSLLTDGGVVVVTTPNIGFFEGRIKFLLTGELWGFGGKNYLSMRHISPISIEQFPLMLEESGFDALELFTAASTSTSLRQLITSPIWLPMRLMLGPFVLGETLVCVGRRSSGACGTFIGGDLWRKS